LAWAVGVTQGDYAEAIRLLDEIGPIARQLGDVGAIAHAHFLRGEAAQFAGDLDAAAARYGEALAMYREIGERGGCPHCSRRPRCACSEISYLLGRVARMAASRGDYGRAASLFEEAFGQARQRGDKRVIAFLLGDLVDMALQWGEVDGAAQHLAEAWALHRESGDTQGIAGCVRDLASVAAMTGRHEPAARLFGAAEALREAIGAWAIGAPGPRHPARYEQAVANARAGLGDDAFAAAWAAGRAMPLEDAITTALAAISQASAAESPPSPAPAACGLSPREREVLALIAERLTDTEIGARLFISPRTASRHVANLFAKLGANSRREALAAAARHGLV